MTYIQVLAAALGVVLLIPNGANGQVWEVQGSAGPTITDAGHSVAVSAGLSPTSWLTILLAVERTHLSGGTQRDGNFVWGMRGGTFHLGTIEARIAPRGRDRFGPYVLAGMSAGVSRPNVNPAFPNRVTNDVRALAAGAGLLIPLRHDLSLVGETRFIFGSDGVEGIVAVAPLRVGLSWRF